MEFRTRCSNRVHSHEGSYEIGQDACLGLLPAASRSRVASTRAPHNPEMLRELARAHESRGGTGAARDYYNRIILVSDSAEERLWAQKQADSVRLQKN